MPETVVEASDLDNTLKLSIAKTEDGKSLLDCFQCGVCTSGCPYSDVLDIMPHQVIKMALLGMKKQLLDCKTIWVCSTCFMCSERCPQGVDLGGVMLALRNIVVRERGVPEGLKSIFEGILTSGRLVKITDMRVKERANLGLPEVPSIDIEAIKKLLKEVDELVKRGG